MAATSAGLADDKLKVSILTDAFDSECLPHGGLEDPRCADACAIIQIGRNTSDADYVASPNLARLHHLTRIRRTFALKGEQFFV